MGETKTQDIDITAQVPKDDEHLIEENNKIIDNIDKIPLGKPISLYDMNDEMNMEFTNKNVFGPLLSESTDREEVVLIRSRQGTSSIGIEVPSKPVEDYQVGMWNSLNEFDTNAWKKGNTGIKTGYPGLDKAFDGGLQSGFIIVAADSNIGKTAFLTQLEWNVAKNNDDVYVMSFSLDDPMPDKISRVVAIDQGLPINLVKYPNKYVRRYPYAVVRRGVGLSELRKHVHTYRAYDSSFTSYAEEIEKEIEDKVVYFKTHNIDKKVVVFIDNFHDMDLKSEASLSEKQKWEKLASLCADLSIKYDIPVICTAELKKLNGARRPTLDDIREASKIKYEAKAVLLCYNELHYKEGNADIYYDDPVSKSKGPIFEVHFAKNKLSSYKGRLFYKFYPAKTTMQECNNMESQGFKQKILNQHTKSFN